MTPLPPIDQRLALATGRRMVAAGPEVSRAEAEQVVTSLRGHADRAGISSARSKVMVRCA